MHDKEFQLGELISILSGFPFDSELFTDDPGQPLIRIRDLLSAEIKTYYSGPFDKRYVVDNGEILIGMDGDFNVIRWAKGPALLNQRVCLVKSASQELDESFLFWLLGPKVESIHKTTPQTTVKHLSVNDLKGLTVRIPERVHQQKIAQILDTLDTQIQKTEALIAKLEKIKEGLLHDLLTRGIDHNGQLRPMPEQAPELYKESALGLIPKEWICSEIEDLLDCPSRSGLYKPSAFHGRGAPMIQMGNIFSSEFVSFEKVGRVSVTLPELKIFGLKNGDLLFARRSLVLEGAGKASLVKDLPEPSTFESSIVRLRLRQNVILPDFAIAFLQSNFSYSDRRKYIRQVAVSGVSSADIRQFLCLLPPLEEQQTIISCLETSRSRITSERKTLAKLKKQKAGLMDDLLTGRVRVTPLLKDAV